MYWPLWILLGAALLVIEVHYTGDFTLFCFGAAALVVGAISAAHLTGLWTQWLIFGVLSGALLFWARDWLRTAMLAKPVTELDNVVGQIAIPLADLPAFGFGKARLRGADWNAHNAANVAIHSGQRCKVMRVEGLTLWIIPE